MNSCALRSTRASALALAATAVLLGASRSASAPASKTPLSISKRAVLPADSKPGGKEAKPVSPAAPCDQKLVLNPDGSVETTGADGTVTIRYASGGYEVREPNGKKHIVLPQNIPTSAPPSPPSDPHLVRWLDHVERALLAKIGEKVGNQAAVDRYMVEEAKVAHTVYERIDHRMSVLARMP